MHPIAAFFFLAALAGILYLCIAIRCLRALRHRPPPSEAFAPPVTILKPICGIEPELYENLLSFCEQRYPQFHVVFGVQSPNDPAIAIIERVIENAPQCDCTLTIGSAVPYANPKIANLHSLVASARHDLLVIADSDMRVDSSYLSRVVAPFERDRVGAATALYCGVPSTGAYSPLAAMCISEHFAPSVLVALKLEKLRYCFGSTMAVRRTALDAIGGLEALAPYLADDYMLGKLVSERGFEIALAATVVRNVVSELTFIGIWSHQLRWARTIRAVRPLGHAGSFITYPVAMAALYLATSCNLAWGLPLLLGSVAATLVLHTTARRSFDAAEPARPWLAPLRDVFGCAIWIASYFGRNVRWREAAFKVDEQGRFR